MGLFIEWAGWANISYYFLEKGYNFIKAKTVDNFILNIQGLFLLILFCWTDKE
jgi:hypothetical protein